MLPNTRTQISQEKILLANLCIIASMGLLTATIMNIGDDRWHWLPRNLLPLPALLGPISLVIMVVSFVRVSISIYVGREQRITRRLVIAGLIFFVEVTLSSLNYLASGFSQR
jgi:hypothetical protein